MDALSAPAAGEGRGIEFTGNWREYFPVAATNALLTICTLGIYRFWAVARQRRYLWSRTYVIDDCLEWTGTGKEMFLGFLIVIAVLAPFFLFIQFLFPALLARGKLGEAAGLMLFFYLVFFYLGGFARFRALRYRLSRSWWHGIRGGSDNPGWGYGGEYLGRYFLASLTLFIMFPWAATRLWNLRWNAMSFGQLDFRADVTSDGLKRYWALLYALPFLVMIVAGIGGVALLGNSQGQPEEWRLMTFGIVVVGFFYLGLPLLTLNFFAAFYRKAAASTALGDLEFDFDATTLQWLGLFLGNVLLAIATLGFGLAYWGYRNWAFAVRHMRIHGNVDVSDLAQSITRAPVEAEGFADAFDVGAI